ncbi:MAG: PAS domain S-box protein [Flavobacteriales bacterium]|nr:PAS domain S-box protein [Flavobacteriales bacterium]
MSPLSASPVPKSNATDAAYLSIVENAPFGIYIVDADFKLNTISAGAQKVFSVVPDPIGRDFGEVMTVLWPEPFRGEALGRFRHTLATGEPYRATRTVEQRAGSGDTEAYDWTLDRITLPDGRPAVVCYFYDMTERELHDQQLRDSKEQQAFLLRLSDATREIMDPRRVADITVELLARQLGVDRCIYGAIDADEVFHLEGEWHRENLAPMPKSMRLVDLGELDLKAGRTVVINDTGADQRVNEDAFDEMGRMRAAVGVPLVKNGNLAAGFGVLDHKPRTWSSNDIRLVEEVCARTWAAVERAHSEDALIRSEERYRTLFRSIDEGFCIIEFLDGPHGPLSDYVHVEANEAYTVNAGIPDIVGQKVRTMVPDEAEEWVKIYRDVLLTGKPIRFERELIATHRHLELSAFRVEPRERRQVAVLFRDITQRKRTDMALRGSEERLRHMVNVPGVGVLTFDHDGTLLSANDAMLDMLGHSRTAFEARTFTWRDLTPPEHVVATERIMNDLRTTGRGGPYDKELFRKDGSRMWFTVAAADLGDGTLVEYAFDIRDRRAAEGAARENHERYQAFMRHSAEGIWRCELERPIPVDLPVHEMLDRAYTDAYLAECNDAMARMYGYTNGDELVGTRLGDLVPRTPENEAYLTAFLQNGYNYMGGESEEKHRDGHTMHFSNNLVGIVHDGHLVRVWGTQSDITERKRAEADLRLLVRVSVDLVRLVTDNALEPTTGDHILRHFGINRLSMADVDLANDRAHVSYDHHLPDMPSILGPHTFSAWRDDRSNDRFANGQPHVVNDTATETGMNAEAYRKIGAGALVTIPVMREGTLVSLFSVTAAEARAWNTSDLELLKELSARIWNAFQRVKAEKALQHELAATRQLAEISTSMVQSGENEKLFERIVEAAAFVMGSRFGSLRKYRKERGELQLVAAYGYPDEARERLQWVRPGTGTTCGKAMQDRTRVVVPDVERCEWLAKAGGVNAYLDIGMRAVQSTPLLARDGEPIGVISTHWDRVHVPTPEELQLFDVLARQAADLIERVRNERLLRENESRFRMATDTGRVGVWEWHVPTDVVTWNDVLYDIQGVSKEAFGGNVEAFVGIIHPDDRERVGAAIQGALDQDEPYAVEFRAVRPDDGRVIHLVTHARVLRDGGLNPERMVGAVVDVTAVREAEAALRAADRRKDEFLATLAHELRNPLAPLRNGLEVLRTGVDDARTLEQIRDMMDRQVNQMAHLVDDLLDVSRISRGVIELRRTRMDVHQAIHQAVEASNPLLQAKSHKLLLELHTAPLMVEADPTRLAQIFGNLLDNASKYTDRGGTIHVISRISPQGAEVTISDTGIGLTPEQLPRVFDMFSQVDRSNTRTRGGLGIGLHIVKRLAEMHEGTIEVTSKGPHKGSCFTLRLPLASRPMERITPDGSTAYVSPRRVLLTDDNVDAAMMISMLLRKAGHQVVVAHSGQEALDKGPQLMPDVVILDIGMPDMDGHETCRRMRALEWGKDAYIIALTGWGQSEDRQRSHDAGFDHHLVKPVVRAELEQVLASARA